MALTILVASFTISLSLLIPINILSLDKSYYRDINYQTSIEFYQGINNMPLNRYNFFPWQGIEYETTDPMYPIAENRLISEYMKQKNDSIWTNIDNPKSPNSINLSDIINQISYNMFDFSGKAISLGWLEAMDNKYHGTAAMSAVSNIVCPIFNLIANGKNNIDNNQDWRQCVENVIASEMPSFVKKYLNNPKTKNRFAIGFNTLPYNPLEDELLTHYNSKINNENIKTHGIKANSKMVKISSELQNKLKTTKTINNKIIIPIIINKTLQIKHRLNVGNIIDFTNTTCSLKYTTNENKWNKIPNNWWSYNSKNQEFINGKWEPQPNTENIWKMPNDKFTSASDKVTYGWTNRYGYQGINDNDKDITQQYSNAKTYRNLNDVILRLPKNDIKDNNGKIIYQGISATTNNYFETLETKQLPTGHQDKFIIATDKTNNKWWVIRPYSIFWNNKTKQYINNSDLASALNLITNGKNLFTLLSAAYWQSKPEEMKICTIP